MARITLPNKVDNMEGARLIPGAVIAAVEFLELDHDVEIRWAAGIARRGAHRWRDKHFITLSTYLTPAGLTRTLWHELTHAAQLERYETSNDFFNATANERRRVGYTASRFETEARRWAADFGADLPLAEWAPGRAKGKPG